MMLHAFPDRFCFDANYNSWEFNHEPYAVVWLAFSFLSFIWIQMMLSLIGTSPAIVLQEHKMRNLIAQGGGSENDEITHGLSVAQVRTSERCSLEFMATIYLFCACPHMLVFLVVFVGLRHVKVPQLRAIYDHADEMIRMPGQGRPGDGEVPLDNIKRSVSTLVNFHRSTSRRKELVKRSRTSIYRHENEAYNLVYGDTGSLTKEESRMLMATTLLFDPDNSGTTQFVEFTLGIRNLRRNTGQLALFGLTVETLDKNIEEYANLLEDVRNQETMSRQPKQLQKSVRK